MLIICIILYFVPIIIAASVDQTVANGMILLTIAVPPVINVLAESKGGRLGLWAIWTSLYYLMAINMVMTKQGHPLFE
jgi:hypothetical protein